MATDESIRSAALRFANEIASMVRSGIAHEVTAQVSRVLDGIARGGKGPSVRLPASSGAGDRRIGKSPVPVQCPVPGCKKVGIRAKRNFCADHAESLSDSEQQKYRDQQLAARGKAGARSGAPARKTARKKK